MKEKIKKSIKVAQLYYLENKSLTAISKQTGMSVATASRLLQYAKDVGVVKIDITNPYFSAKELAETLSDHYQVPIQVVPNLYGNETNPLASLGQYVASYLREVIHPHDILGIGWGKTIKAIADHLIDYPLEDVQVVQLKGHASLSAADNYAMDGINAFGRAFHTKPNFLPLPTIFDTARTKTLVEEDRYIHRILELGRQANVALYTVGSVKNNALFFQLGFLDQKEIESLQAEAVGDIVSRFYDKNGQIVNKGLDDRTVGISLEDLKQKERRILVATGSRKVIAFDVAVRTGHCSEAIIDEQLGQALLDLMEVNTDENG
ncbi:MAG: sugar-binding domain-containing protein [Aerococcus sp.]|nr:sugar-binding domain-containing protein [Aerococcus sp.]